MRMRILRDLVAKRPRRFVVVVAGLVVVAVAIAWLSMDDLGDREQVAAGSPSAPSGPCILHATQGSARLCVTTIEGTEVTFLLEGFQPQTGFRATLDGGTLSGEIFEDGTNRSPSGGLPSLDAYNDPRASDVAFVVSGRDSTGERVDLSVGG